MPARDHYVGISGRDPGAGLSSSDPLKVYEQIHRRFPEVTHPFGVIGHDAALALVEGGRLVFAVEEERLNRVKHSYGLPDRALDLVRPSLASAPIVSYYLDPGAEHRDIRSRFQQRDVQGVGREYDVVQSSVQALAVRFPGLRLVHHHLAHAASAFFTSGMSRALVLVIDGYGESHATSLFVGEGSRLRQIRAWDLASSLGMFYARFTMFLGFAPLEDEYKVMGLAAYGDGSDYMDFFASLVEPADDDGFRIPTLRLPSAAMFPRWAKILGHPRRPDEPIDQRHIAIAHALQKTLEHTVLTFLTRQAERQGTRHLCLAGGVALNCAMNGAIDRSRLFDKIWVQPAASDAGTAIGSALHSYFADHPEQPHARMPHVYWGPSFSEREAKQALEAFGAAVRWHRPDDFFGAVAALIAEGKVIGWFNGAMEFGPRALGNRSILADPRRSQMKDLVNKAVKKREEFRPFAPSVTAEHAEDFFELHDLEQYETMTIAVRARPVRAKEIPSVVHVDGTARVHVVRREANAAYWQLISRFGSLTGVPVLLNTSFNVRGEPIVCTPEDAVRCFLGTGIDHLALQGYLISKAQ